MSYGFPWTRIPASATPPVVQTFDKVIITVGESVEQTSPSIAMLRFGTSGSGGGYSTDQTTFLAAHPGLTLQDFSGITPPNTNTTTIPSFSGFTWTSDGTRFCFGVGSSSAPFDFIWSTATILQQSFILTFSPAINAVGFNMAQNNGLPPDLVEFYDGVTLLDSQTVTANIYSVFDTFVGYAT